MSDTNIFIMLYVFLMIHGPHRPMPIKWAGPSQAYAQGAVATIPAGRLPLTLVNLYMSYQK